MSFVTAFNALPFDALLQRARDASPGDVAQCLARGPRSLADFATLISPAAGQSLETLCANSQSLTRQRFGNVIRLFAPLYLSNECVNNCKYCGFSRDNPILRVTLSVDEVMREARELKSQGFRNILLV
ncbi:MAG: 2-iminoacetate synthase, partial [Limisphaerales bacterium]